MSVTTEMKLLVWNDDHGYHTEVSEEDEVIYLRYFEATASAKEVNQFCLGGVEDAEAIGNAVLSKVAEMRARERRTS